MSSSSGTPSSGSASTTQPSAGYIKRDALIGKSVISKNAEIIGSVRDIAVSMDGRIAIQVERKKDGDSVAAGEDLFIGSDEIQAMGDVILLKTSTEMAGKGVQMESKQPDMGAAPAIAAGSSAHVSGSGSSSMPEAPKPPPPLYPSTSAATGKTCPKCGFYNSSTSRFCIKCGSAL
jgi:sporulation protein YlmC with PRC-barrel domain